MFTDPASGGDAHSYPLPAPSACEGIIKSVASCQGVDIEVVAVGLSFVPRWTPYTTTTMTPLRKSNLIDKGVPYLAHESFLYQPVFQILACLSNAKNWRSAGIAEHTNNPAHMMQDHFFRRLKNGRTKQPVALGRHELLASYCGQPRTVINEDYNTFINAMSSPRFVNNRLIENRFKLEIREGVAHYSKAIEVVNRDGFLCFTDKLQEALNNATK
jgi:CRISPR-associated Cas5-like protein